MKRRQFLNTLATISGSLAATCAIPRIYAAPSEYQGRFLVTLQMDGGWDVTSLCDPKMNPPGEQIINNWALNNDIQTAGRINYAPFASNDRLFQRHYQKMVVINGVDAQTNSHTTGVLHNWSGRNQLGLPSLTALFAAVYAPDMPLAYTNYGGFADTANLIRYSRLNDYQALIDLLSPTSLSWDRTRDLVSASRISRVHQFQQQALNRRLALNNLTPRQRENLTAYQSARSNRDTLQYLMDILPPESDIKETTTLPGTNFYSSLMRQIQLSLLTFKSGVGVASDLNIGGFDTHTQHDIGHGALFNHFADAIDYFWDYADQLEIADRLTLVIGSDFSRTPNYNADAGKDHWPIGSYIVMERAPIWGNRVVGITDDMHNALPINASSLQSDTENGLILYPKHVHQALRKYLGLDEFAGDQQLTFGATEDVDLFNSNKWTV